MKRMKLSQELIAILAVGVTLTGLQVTLFVSLRGEMSELRGEMGSMETRLRGEMHGLRDEMRGEMSDLRAEMRGEMNVLRETSATTSTPSGSTSRTSARTSASCATSCWCPQGAYDPILPWRRPRPGATFEGEVPHTRHWIELALSIGDQGFSTCVTPSVT